jgi:hypothetical protein
MTTDMDDAEIKSQVVSKLVEKFPEKSAQEIEEIVAQEFAALQDRPIRDYLSVLTERAAKQRIKKDAKR